MFRSNLFCNHCSFIVGALHGAAGDCAVLWGHVPFWLPQCMLIKECIIHWRKKYFYFWRIFWRYYLCHRAKSVSVLHVQSLKIIHINRLIDVFYSKIHPPKGLLGTPVQFLINSII